ncbi:MAG: BamA/TamA family outer membrane protein [Saprospiraceae bacterium]|nr:BamA/TamA family outer membrane protein [Saprospiraceae bacterium]
MLLLLSPAFLPAQTLRLCIDARDAAAWGNLQASLTPRPLALAADTFLIKSSDSSSLTGPGEQLLRQLRAQAYLSASIDSFHVLHDSLATARLYLGPPLYWLRLRPAGAENQRWLEAAGFREKLFSGKALRYDLLLRQQEAILEQAENNGYPFAAVRLDSIELQADGAVSAALRLDRGTFFTIRGLNVKGNIRLPKSYLPQYLGLRSGMPYSRAKILRLQERLRSLLFVESVANPTVTFAGNEATLNLFLQKKRASRFDFIIGLLPQSTASDSRLLLTGTLSAAFLNALSLGERLSVELERLRPETQKLDVQTSIPYVLGLPFGVDARLGIFRRDSTWVDAQSEVGVQYLLEGGDYLKFFWENKSSSLQKIDTALLLQTHRLPAVLDLRQNGFGLETAFNRLDYRFNPRRGWALLLRGVAGFNTVLRNNQIEALRDPEQPEFRFASLYDSLAGRSTRFRLEGRVEGYLPLFLRSTLKLSLRGGGVFSEKPVFANEQYRLGGNKLLRGFDEESLFATRYTVATAEFRLLLAQNSFLAVFTDYGYLENITDRTRLFLRPWGMGAGLNFETTAGIFGISLAVGRRDAGQGIDFRTPKFHLGYVSLF